jgi:hypothetical protein
MNAATKTKTYRATAKDVALCAKAHLADGNQDAADDICNWYTCDVDGGARSMAARTVHLRKHGIGQTLQSGPHWTTV